MEAETLNVNNFEQAAVICLVTQRSNRASAEHIGVHMKGSGEDKPKMKNQ